MAPLKHEDRVEQAISFSLDITERRRAEQEQAQLREQMQHTQKLESLGVLAGGIAHDFNNLLGAILGYGEMALRNVRAGSRMRRDIERIMIAGERGRALVDRILAFSRSGVAERVAVQVEEVVRETLGLFVAKIPSGIVGAPYLVTFVPSVWVMVRSLRAAFVTLMRSPLPLQPVIVGPAPWTSDVDPKWSPAVGILSRKMESPFCTPSVTATLPRTLSLSNST